MRSPFCLELLSRKPSWPAFMCERTKQAGHMDASDLIKALQNTLQGGGRPHMETDGYGGKLRRKSCARRVGRRRLEISQKRGATPLQPCRADARTCKIVSRWCDQSIHDERNSAFSSGPLRGRRSVWNSCRGNHLGQRSCASAQIGRTYGRKRFDQSTAKHLARRGPSTYVKSPLVGLVGASS